MKAGDILRTSHPLVHRIILTRVMEARPQDAAHTVGITYEGWLNDSTAAANYFTLKRHPTAGWLANLGTGWAKTLTGRELAELMGLTGGKGANTHPA
jgi:hypothetical protein